MKQRITIIGAGLMGHGLAVVFASGGHHVAVHDPVDAALQSVKGRIAQTLASLERDPSIVDQVSTQGDFNEAVQSADIVIEAAPEKVVLKQEIFRKLEAAAMPHAILASNTSVIPIGKIAGDVKSKHRVLGTHWWNPPYLVPLVEVIQMDGTSLVTVSKMMALLTSLGKTPVHVKKDVPGFVGNRLQHALWREAISLIEHGVCDAETIDLVVKNSFGTRLAVLGPIENADLVGTDLTLDIHHQVLADLEDTHVPSPYLEKLVADGKLGFKTNHGFKSWTEEQKATLRAAVTAHLKNAFK